MRNHRGNEVDGVAVRHLDEIQEEDVDARPSRVSALVLASFGGATIVFCALALMRSSSEPAPQPHDPLSALVEQANEAPAAAAKKTKPKREKLAAQDVTFPQVLSDQESTTTAMALVRSGKNTKLTVDAPEMGEGLALPYDTPPEAGDRLPVIPLPAQDMLPRARPQLASGDTLKSMAKHASREEAGVALAEPGTGGGYQLQVASFKKAEDAEGFATALRRRGHRAHVEQAHVRGRGLWHRVRIGSFKYKRSADIYRQNFEAKERMVTFVVNPPKARIHIGPAGSEG